MFEKKLLSTIWEHCHRIPPVAPGPDVALFQLVNSDHSELYTHTFLNIGMLITLWAFVLLCCCAWSL